MTYTIIENQIELSHCRKKILQAIRKRLTQKIKIRVGYPGNSFTDEEAHYDPDLKFWMSIDAPKAKKHRYWQGFGIGHYKSSGSNSIIGEINFPHAGINRRIAGVFIKDKKGKIWVAHRGKIGGGKKGVGKLLFWKNWAPQKTIEVISGKRKEVFAVISELTSPHLVDQVFDFIQFIDQLKKGILVPDILPQYNYSDEFFGNVLFNRAAQVNYTRWHGEVIRSLYMALKSRGYNVGRNKHIDLYVGNKKRITTIFEAKTGSLTSDFYTAIGQLLCYSARLPFRVKRVLVIPELPPKDIQKALKELGIDWVLYRWMHSRILFINFNSLSL